MQIEAIIDKDETRPNFWEDFRKLAEFKTPPLFVGMHLFTFNSLHGYPYGKSRRGAKKLVKRTGAKLEQGGVFVYFKS